MTIIKRVKPLTPEEGLNIKPKIPFFVLDAVNELLEENLHKGLCEILQKDIISRVLTKTDKSSDEIYASHFMDFEDEYRKIGWTVTYDSPAYSENYEASFTFNANKG